MEALQVNDLVSQMARLCSEQAGVEEFLGRVGSFLKGALGADDVIIRNTAKKGERASTAEEFALNTRKPYTDYNLSGYSAFSELINYYNNGFKSCMILPLTTESKALGAITLLSRREEAFGGAAEVLGPVLDLASHAYGSRIEKEKGMNAAKYFNAAFDNAAPQAILGRSGNLVKANKELLNIIGKPSKEIVGKSAGELFGIDAEGVSELGRGFPVKTSIGARMFKVTAELISESAMHVMMTDLSDAEALAIREEMMGRGDAEFFVLLDGKGRISWISRNAEEILRSESEDKAGAWIGEIVDDGKMLRWILEEKSEQYLGKARLGAPGAQQIDVAIRAHRSAAGFSLVVSKDITRYLENAQKNIEEIIRFSGDAVLILDNVGYVKNANRSAARILRYDGEAMKEIPLASVCHDEESQRKLSSALGYAKANGHVSETEIVLTRKDNGEAIPFSFSIRAVRSGVGGEVDYMLIGRELATKALVDKLKRDLDFVSKQMQKTKMESELKTQFIYNISHDLRTPLTSIIGYTKLMLQKQFGELTQEQEKTMVIVREESGRLLQLIAQILDAAKLSSGKIKLDLQQVNFNVLKDNPSIQALADAARKKGLEFTFSVDYNVPEIEADPNRLIQAFVNLIWNAIKFTEQGSVNVKVFRKGKNIRVEVQDTGIGIPKEDRPKLFKKFFQLQRKGLTMQQGAGTGLGLTITKEIVTLHGGRISEIPAPGRGSIFWFTLPVYGPQKKKARDEKDAEGAEAEE